MLSIFFFSYCYYRYVSLNTPSVFIRVREERIIIAPGCVMGRELLQTDGLLLLLSRPGPKIIKKSSKSHHFGIEKIDIICADQMALNYEKSINDAEKQIENIS